MPVQANAYEADPGSLFRGPLNSSLSLFFTSPGTFIPSFIIEFVFSVPPVVGILIFAFLSILDSYVA